MNKRSRFVTTGQAVGLCLALLFAMPLLGQTTKRSSADTDPDVDVRTLTGDGFTGRPLKPTYIESWEASATGDDIYSRASPLSVAIPPELKDFWKKTTTSSRGFRWIVNAAEFGLDPKDWQSDPSRIIYQGGKYHMWMIDERVRPLETGTLDIRKPRVKGKGMSRILYLTSVDTHRWTAVDYLPLGPKGSCYDESPDQANVIYHEGRFYLFSNGYTSNIGKYGQRNAGIFCLVADAPEGPWKQPDGVDLLLKPEIGSDSFDNSYITNPRHIFLNGKWFMYYKGGRKGFGPLDTENGVAIADSLLGPYRKYEGNPVMKGHGHFCWRYKHGMIYISFQTQQLAWSEDGIHFAPIVCPKKDLFIFGSLYVPYDPLFGDPVTNQPVTSFWGFESELMRQKNPRDWDMVRMEWGFGPAAGEPAQGTTAPKK